MIVENVVAFEIAAAVVEKYVGHEPRRDPGRPDALHELNRERLAHWGESVEPTVGNAREDPSNRLDDLEHAIGLLSDYGLGEAEIA